MHSYNQNVIALKSYQPNIQGTENNDYKLNLIVFIYNNNIM